MKFDDSTDTVLERSGLSSEGQFGILFNAKMSKILSDGLYSDKIQSIIRELSCNAIDSHVEAKCGDLPIEVHLPSTLEPWFYVRDFGTGLDHKQVVDIYTIYGASTKTNSNEFIGALGLGSKSPFSYVDAFDVTARKNGVERQYSMFRNEKGKPDWALLGEFPTTEPNGVTVKMPVKQEDIRLFSEKAALVFSWFDIKPNITGVRDLNIPTHKILYEGNNWKIRERNRNVYNSGPSNQPIALMGRVAYPLDVNSISNLSPVQKVMLSIPTILMFNIGDLEVAASRESLGYDNRTQENIRKKLDLMLQELAENFEKKVATATTEWDARRIFGEIFGSDGGFRHEFQTAFSNKGLLWGNKLIKDSFVQLPLNSLWDPNKVSTPMLWRATHDYKSLRQIRYYETITIRCTNDIIIVFNDLDKGAQSRVNHLHQQNNCQQEILLFGSSDLKSIKQIVNMLGNPTYKLASQLPKRPTSVSERVKMLTYRKNPYYNNGSNAWETVDVDLDDGGFYVLMDRYTVKDGEVVRDNLYRIYELSVELGIINTKKSIYSPRAEMRKKVFAHNDWVNFFDFVRESVAKRLTPAVLQAIANINEYHRTTKSSHVNELWQNVSNIKNSQGTFAKFADAMRVLHNLNKTYEKHHLLIELSKIMDKPINLPPPSVETTKLYNAVISTYPMLDLITTVNYYDKSIDSRKAAIYSNYINMVDEFTNSCKTNAVEQLISA
jgi:hypothetical protein